MKRMLRSQTARRSRPSAIMASGTQRPRGNRKGAGMKRLPTVRTLALVSVLLVAGGALLARVEAQSLETVRFSAFTVPRFVTLGENLGFFAREGLNLDTASTQNSEQQLAELRDQQ